MKTERPKSKQGTAHYTTLPRTRGKRKTHPKNRGYSLGRRTSLLLFQSSCCLQSSSTATPTFTRDWGQLIRWTLPAVQPNILDCTSLIYCGTADGDWLHGTGWTVIRRKEQICRCAELPVASEHLRQSSFHLSQLFTGILIQASYSWTSNFPLLQ